MKSLWGKIGFGALGIFLAGMLLVTVVRDAKSTAQNALRSALGAGATRLARAGTFHDMPFRLAGEQLGEIRRLVIQRGAEGELPDVSVDVELSDPGSLALVADCDLVPEGKGDFDVEGGFRCTARGTGDYVKVGSAAFSPGHLVRPLMVPRRLETDLRSGDPFHASVEMDGDVRVSARGKHGQLVRIRADSTSAHIRVSDALGRALLRLLADSNGASLRVRSADGRDLVRMEASEGGFTLTVDTAAVRE